MAVNLVQIPRKQKSEVADKLRKNLVARAAKGPEEAGLDAFIPELADVIVDLNDSTAGNTGANAERIAKLALLNEADDDVDRWYRHTESYLYVESIRRTGPNIALATALHHAAFPHGLAHIDDPVPEENRICRESLVVLRSAVNAPTLAAIAMPLAWLDIWAAAIDKSQELHDSIEKARASKKTHVTTGQDAEVEAVEIFVRLRHYMSSRPRAKSAESKELLAPLLDVVAELRATAKLRATARKNKKGKGEGEGEDGKGEEGSEGEEKGDAAKGDETAKGEETKETPTGSPTTPATPAATPASPATPTPAAPATPVTGGGEPA